MTHRTAVAATRSPRRERHKELVRAAKDRPCTDCGGSFPYYVMDFDHLDPSEKVDQVGVMLGYSTKRILAEIAKCEVVCANCHRVRTHLRNQYEDTR